MVEKQYFDNFIEFYLIGESIKEKASKQKGINSKIKSLEEKIEFIEEKQNEKDSFFNENKIYQQLKKKYGIKKADETYNIFLNLEHEHYLKKYNSTLKKIKDENLSKKITYLNMIKESIKLDKLTPKEENKLIYSILIKNGYNENIARTMCHIQPKKTRNKTSNLFEEETPLDYNKLKKARDNQTLIRLEKQLNTYKTEKTQKNNNSRNNTDKELTPEYIISAKLVCEELDEYKSKNTNLNKVFTKNKYSNEFTPKTIGECLENLSKYKSVNSPYREAGKDISTA